MGIDQTQPMASDDRGEFLREARNYTEYLAVDTADGSFLVNTSGRQVERDLFTTGADSRAATLEIALAALERLGVLPEVIGGTLIEAGAGLGAVTVPAIRRHGFAGAVCFEPEPEEHLLLQLNCAWNSIADVVDAHPIALSSGGGTIALVYDSGAPLNYRLQARSRKPHIRVPRRRLDEIAVEDGVELSRASLLWIGAHGHALEVMRGASELTARGLPIVVEDGQALLGRPKVREQVLALLEGSHTHFVRLGSADASSDRRPISELQELEGEVRDRTIGLLLTRG